jgi:beta-glucanase (GH16 family)
MKMQCSFWLAGCVLGAVSTMVTGGAQGQVLKVATPEFAAVPALHGALIVRLSDATTGSRIYYTVDGSVPTASSPEFLAPFLVASNVTVQAIGVAQGSENSEVARREFSPKIASGTLVWSEEFNNATGANERPDPAVWGYDSGGNGWGNHELEYYCAWGADGTPCSSAAPNSYVGTDGVLHVVARESDDGKYTSAKLKTQGKFSFLYGRLEFRIQAPEAKGLWPAGWLLGNDVTTTNWPGCGEMDVMERINGATTPDFNSGSVHGLGFTGIPLGKRYSFPAGQTAAGWHTYGMIWKPGSVSYYIDDPKNVYVTFTPESLKGIASAKWPFDEGKASFLILNLAVGGDWPGPPTPATPFPSQLLVDFIRLFTY